MMLSNKELINFIKAKSENKRAKTGIEKIKAFLKFIKAEGLYPEMLKIEEGATESVARINGKEVLMFASNNYLGLAKHKKVYDASSKALKENGLGPCGSRLLAGNLELHKDLESLIAKLVGKEDAIVFATGYMANTGAIPALVEPLMNSLPFKKGSSVIFSDELNHATIIDACRLARGEKIIYRHKDIDDLEKKIKSQPRSKNKLIITDGIFSMDGDIAPLDEIVKVAKKYNCMVMVDDAHATGIMGKNGAGTASHFNVTKETDIIMSTFNKGYGGMGGFIAADKEVIEYLRIASRSYVFSLALPAVITAGVIASIKESMNEKYRKEVLDNSDYLRKGLKNLGFYVFGDTTPINPVLIGEESKGIRFSKELLNEGIFAPCVRWPAVEKGKSRIRLVVTANHERKDLDKLIKSFQKIGSKLGVI